MAPAKVILPRPSDKPLSNRVIASSAAEDLLEIVMRRYERAGNLLTSNRPVDDWGKLLGDCAVTAMLDRLLHQGHVLKMRPTELAHENRLASTGGVGVKQPSPRPVPLAGFEVLQ